MQRTQSALTVPLLATSLLSLVACATAPSAKPSADPDPVTIEARPQPKDDKVEERDADADAEPVVKADPSDPPSGRNQGFGPYDDIEAICGAEEERCRMGEAVAVVGSSSITRMASFAERPSDGSAHLAFETKEGWFLSYVPDGQPFGGGLSHHTPASTHFYLDKARVDGDGVVLLRGFGQSMFIPGRGSEGSRSFEEVLRLKCAVLEGRVACGAGKPVFSRVCEDGQCKQTGVHPAERS